MTTLVINDLNISKELDSKAMAGVIGGFSHGYGNYDKFDRGSWKLIYRNAYRARVYKNGKRYHAIQYHYTWKRTQYWYRGRVRYLHAV